MKGLPSGCVSLVRTDVMSESGEEDGVSGGGSEVQYYSAHNMFDVPRDTESETAFSINRNLS